MDTVALALWVLVGARVIYTFLCSMCILMLLLVLLILLDRRSGIHAIHEVAHVRIISLLLHHRAVVHRY